MKEVEMKDSEILISIIVPVYNAGDTLERCVCSILAQNYKNLQIILIDDGSTDSTFVVSEQLALRDGRIEVYHTKNGGSVSARKFGLKIAKGQYIGFVDADDYIDPDMFQSLLQALMKADADFVHSGHIEENERGKRVFCNFSQTVFDINDFQSKREFMKDYIMCNTGNCAIAPSLCTKLFKKELIIKCFELLDDNQQYGEGLICLLRCVLESRKIMLYRRAMYHYAVKEKSLSHLEPNNYMIKEIGMWHYMLKVLDEYRYLKTAKEDICFFLRNKMIQVISYHNQTDKRVPQYCFREISRIIGKKIVLFGAGNVGKDYYTQFSKYKECNIVAWVDSHWDKYHFEYIDVISLEKVLTMFFDLVVIAVKDAVMAEEIRNLLAKAGVPKSKIVWDEPGEFF